MMTDPRTLAAYLYLHRGEAMPAPVLDAEGELDVAADDAAITAWSQVRDPFTVDMARLSLFIVRTEGLLINLQQLELDPAQPVSPQYMAVFYDAAKSVFDNDAAQLRTYFSWLYLVLFQRDEGPRWGDFVEILGVDEFVSLTRARFAQLI